jgi:hypothetical protein
MHVLATADEVVLAPYDLNCVDLPYKQTVKMLYMYVIKMSPSLILQEAHLLHLFNLFQV